MTSETSRDEGELPAADAEHEAAAEGREAPPGAAPQEAAPPGAAPQEAAPQEAAEAGAPPAAADAPDHVDAGPSREQELTQQLQRLAADFANYQKRVQRDKAKWNQDATRGLLEDLVPVLDSLDQAIAAFDRPVTDPAVYREGVVLVREELLRRLGTYDVQRIDPAEGIPFDPDLHEAILVQEAEGIDGQQVAFCARTGYRIGDAVLRPAQVGVKKPKAS